MICDDEEGTKWKPSTQMPRWASRITLVHHISFADCRAEGADEGWEGPGCDAPNCWRHIGEKYHFQEIWNSIYAKQGFGWDANPWVAAYTFTVHKKNIDQVYA